MALAHSQALRRLAAIAVEVAQGRHHMAVLGAARDLLDRQQHAVRRVFIDEELGREGFTYILSSGRSGTVHVEQVREDNKDPAYLRDLLLYKLTIEAQKRVEASPLSKREIVRRLGTSATQLYRLLDQTNYQKSVDQLLSLLQVLDCDVDLKVRAKTA